MLENLTSSVWEGVYDSFESAPDTSAVFDADIWVTKQRQRVLSKLASVEEGTEIASAAESRDYPFAAMVSAMLGNETCGIIDYGGAMGQSYLDLFARVPEFDKRVDYTVVETKAVVEAVPHEMKSFPNLNFVSSFTDAPTTADIFHVGSTLQYIDDWRDFFRTVIARFNPQLIILSDLLVGEVPSFVTIQKYYDRSIKVRFINIEEFLTFWKTVPFSLVYKSYYQPLSGEDYFPDKGLPQTHRIRKPCHLVFSREKV